MVRVVDRWWPEAAADDRRSPALAYALMAVVWVAYPVQQVLTQPRFVLGGEMWAEMATNYWVNANAPSLWTRLLAPDVGYTPLPQRIIGLVGHVLNIPPGSIPYFYTGAALLLTPALVATFCLPVFREVVPSDLVRAGTAAFVLLTAEFAVRTYINFTYFGAVLVLALTALAATRRTRDVPAWAWIVPLLVLSKPAALALVPAIVAVGVVSGRRFRRIAIVSTVVALAQAARLAGGAAQSGGSVNEPGDASLATRLVIGLKYAVGYVGRFVLGPSPAHSNGTLLAIGLLTLVAAAAALLLLRSRATALVVVGLLLVLFASLVSAVSFQVSFGPDLARLADPGYDRRSALMLIGFALAAAGLVSAVASSPVVVSLARRVRRWPRGAGRATAVLVLGVWVACSSWPLYVAQLAAPVGVPIVGVSTWRAQAATIVQADQRACVPLTPLGWFWGRDCTVLASDDFATPFEWRTVQAGEELTVEVPGGVREAALAGVQVVVRPAEGGSPVVLGRLLVSGGGTTTELRGASDLGADGGSLLFTSPTDELARGTDAATLRLDTTAQVAFVTGSGSVQPLGSWMGTAGS